TVYIGTLGGSLYAVSSAGKYLWSYQAGMGIASSPAVGKDGTVYFGSWDYNVYAVKAVWTRVYNHGVWIWMWVPNLVWTYNTGNTISSSPAIDVYGTVYIGSWNGNLYALDGATGNLKWYYATGGAITYSSPAIDANGVVYVGSNDGKV